MCDNRTCVGHLRARSTCARAVAAEVSSKMCAKTAPFESTGVGGCVEVERRECLCTADDDLWRCRINVRSMVDDRRTQWLRSRGEGVREACQTATHNGNGAGRVFWSPQCMGGFVKLRSIVLPRSCRAGITEPHVGTSAVRAHVGGAIVRLVHGHSVTLRTPESTRTGYLAARRRS